MFRNSSQVVLSKEECEAAYRLAAALTNHDSEDYRSLKFLEVQVRDEKRKTKSRSDTKSMI
jgi:hypothetical protein